MCGDVIVMRTRMPTQKRRRRKSQSRLRKRNANVLLRMNVYWIATAELIDFEDLLTIFLSREKLVSYLSNTFFDEIVRNDFVLHRETIGDVIVPPFTS